MRRAPGVFFDSEDSKMFSGKSYTAKIIPIAGSWLDFEYDGMDLLYFRIDKKRKVPISYLFKMLGMSIEDVLSYYYRGYTLEFKNKHWIIDFDYENSLGKSFDYDIVDCNTNEIVIPKGRKITKVFANKLKEKGFSKYILTDDINETFVLLKDIVDKNSGEVLFSAGTSLDRE